MTETKTLTGFTKQAIEALSRANGEPDWMLARRFEAWHVYEETPFPAANDELWRRTSLNDLKLEAAVRRRRNCLRNFKGWRTIRTRRAF
ncbi:MAG: hypothetical protein DCC52_05270 [Chloroflexi bacterium]|nr:MAG: hypothetical protein DCC52_05270 [Chloroflexota bacterium]